MKKVLLLFVALFTISSMVAQSTATLQSEKGVTSFRGQDPSTVVISDKHMQIAGSKTSLNESFEGTTFPPMGWTLIDADADGENFFAYSTGSAHTGSFSATSASWTSAAGPLTPDNHLVTPALIVATGDTLSFWYAAQDAAYPSDKFQVLVSTSGKAAADFTDTLYLKTITDSTWTEQKLSLTAYANDTIYVSFNHFDCTDWFYMKLDDIVTASTVYFPPDMAVTDITAPISGCGLGSSEDVTIEITNNGPDPVSTFDIAFKVDNGTYTTESYSGTAIPGFGSTTYTFTAKADLSTAGSHTITAKVTYTADTDASNDEMTGTVENFAGATIPYTMGFEAGESLAAWTLIDVAGDAATWYPIENGQNPNNGTGYAYCTSPSSDDWLITPCLDLVSGQDYEVSAWFKTKVGGNESFSIMIGQSNDAAGLTTKLKDVTVAADAYDKTAATFTVATSGLYYIGFHANSASSAQTLYIDDIMIDDIFTGINNSSTNNAVSMYPNPADNLLNIRSAQSINNIKIVSVIGQEVKSVNPAANQITLDISNLESGIYFVTISTDNGSVIKKLTIK